MISQLFHDYNTRLTTSLAERLTKDEEPIETFGFINPGDEDLDFPIPEYISK